MGFNRISFKQFMKGKLELEEPEPAAVEDTGAQPDAAEPVSGQEDSVSVTVSETPELAEESGNYITDLCHSFTEGFKKFWSVATDHHVNKKTYFILSLLFGAMGIHRFYARHYLSGIFYLSFFFVGFLFLFVYRIGMVIIIPLELMALCQGIWVFCKKSGPDNIVEV